MGRKSKLKNQYRIETEDTPMGTYPTLVFFALKPTVEELKEVGEKLNKQWPTNIWRTNPRPKDKTGTVFHVEVFAQKTAPEAGPVTHELDSFRDEVEANRVNIEKGKVIAQTAAVLREARVNVSLTEEQFEKLKAEGVQLGLLPGQMARLYIIKALGGGK